MQVQRGSNDNSSNITGHCNCRSSDSHSNGNGNSNDDTNDIGNSDCGDASSSSSSRTGNRNGNAATAAANTETTERVTYGFFLNEQINYSRSVSALHLRANAFIASWDEDL